VEGYGMSEGNMKEERRKGEGKAKEREGKLRGILEERNQTIGSMQQVIEKASGTRERL
jgi:hypothetical protein